MAPISRNVFNLKMKNPQRQRLELSGRSLFDEFQDFVKNRHPGYAITRETFIARMTDAGAGRLDSD
jgi:hypothetical protein